MLVTLFVLLVAAAGPDVVVSQIQSPVQYGTTSDTAAFAAAITLCNLGDTPLNFMFLPDPDHPVGVHNFYRWSDGRLIQIGQSWGKHEFCALQSNACNLGCTPQNCALLGVGCSTTSGAGLNAGPNLGARSEVDPTTGLMDGGTANNHAAHTHTNISHGLQVAHADLDIPGARFFYEVLYVAADDALHGNAANNASYREVTVGGGPGQWALLATGPTHLGTAVLDAWEGAEVSTLDTGLVDGILHVAAHVTPLKGGQWRYEYAVANMSSARGVRAVEIPVGTAAVTASGFHLVRSHDEGWSNAPWTFAVQAGVARWSTAPFDDDPDANALRWGTQLNVWFVADAPPTPALLTVSRFAPGPGPDVSALAISAPAAAAPCAAPTPPAIVASDPPHGAIDARMPHALDDPSATFAGWEAITLTLDGDAAGVTPLDFGIVMVGENAPQAQVVGVVSDDPDHLTVLWEPAVPPRTRATLTHHCSGNSIDIGYLPGDVDQNGFTGALDILALIDRLNSGTPIPAAVGDLNRSGSATPADILTLIDLLNGAGAFEPWDGASLP